jgi:hypothetical protein
MAGCHHKHHLNSPSFLSNQAFLWTILACPMVVFLHRASHFLHNPRHFLHSHKTFNLAFLLLHSQLISALWWRGLERQSKLLVLQHLLPCALARYYVFPEKKSNGLRLFP